MTVIIALFLVLIFLQLVAFGVAGFLAWKKIEVFLTWNTRYTAEEYERAVTATGKPPKPSLPASKTEVNGRQVKAIEDLVDISEVDFETGWDAIAKMGES